MPESHLSNPKISRLELLYQSCAAAAIVYIVVSFDPPSKWICCFPRTDRNQISVYVLLLGNAQ